MVLDVTISWHTKHGPARKCKTVDLVTNLPCPVQKHLHTVRVYVAYL